MNEWMKHLAQGLARESLLLQLQMGVFFDKYVN